MLIYQNPSHSKHDGRQEMYRGKLVPCHESPARLDYVFEELRKRPVGELRTPDAVDFDLIRRVHTPRYVDFLAGAWDAWIAIDPANAALDVLPSVWPVRSFRHDIEPTNFAARVGLFSFDSGTPLMSGTWEAACQGAACATSAARAVAAAGAQGAAMALTRPPGHHAGADFFGGYCFLNNAAIAAQALRDAGAERVAILDVDYHHGNGTQSIFYERNDVLTVSIHGDPTTEYPFFLGYADERGQGAGEGYNLNLPLPIGTDFARWMQALDAGIEAVSRFKADAVVVALGVDTYGGDPISRFTLDRDDFLTMGRRLAQMQLPTVFTMEGGYAVADVGVNVVNVLDGFGR